MSEHYGTCRCAGVAIEITGKPHFTGYCHCDDCRRSMGAPITSFAGFKDEEFNWKAKETLSEWRNGEFSRLFCKPCGSPVAYTDKKLPDVVFFYIGFMKNPSAFPPENHSYHNEKISWLKISDNLPKFDKTSYDRPA